MIQRCFRVCQNEAGEWCVYPSMTIHETRPDVGFKLDNVAQCDQLCEELNVAVEKWLAAMHLKAQ